MATNPRLRREIMQSIQEIYLKFLIQVIAVINLLLHNLKTNKRRRSIQPAYSMIDKIPHQVRHLNRLVSVSDVDCIVNLRMGRNAFGRLCKVLRDSGSLTDGKYVTVEEQTAMFLSILAHHKKNRVIGFDFLRSGYTVSYYVNMVLKAILKLHDRLLVKPTPVTEDSNDNRWKWFKGCLGALDGTYISVTVPTTQQPIYRSRKGQICVNTLGVCDRELNFVYILPGWEGSAADSRVLRDAINRNHGLKVPKGNYYLVDNGYANSEGFLAPYRGVRYHLKEWGAATQRPQNPQELFNMRHSKARNVIERSFGIMKKRWGILRSASYYPVKVQNRLIMACFLLHNFIRFEMPEDPIELEFDDNEDDHGGDEVPIVENDFIGGIENTGAWNSTRDQIAEMMWASFDVMDNSSMNSVVAPNCFCGSGKMDLKLAGPYAKNRGRLYYKCPRNGMHFKKIIWYDEVHRVPTIANGSSLIGDTQPEFLSHSVACASVDSSTATTTSERSTSRFRTDMEAQLFVIVMCFVLVLFGVIIGKLL